MTEKYFCVSRSLKQKYFREIFCFCSFYRVATLPGNLSIQELDNFGKNKYLEFSTKYMEKPGIFNNFNTSVNLAQLAILNKLTNLRSNNIPYL